MPKPLLKSSNNILTFFYCMEHPAIMYGLVKCAQNHSQQSPRPLEALLHLDDTERILHTCFCPGANPQNAPLCLASTSSHQSSTANDKRHKNKDK